MNKELKTIMERYRKEMLNYWQASPKKRKEILALKKAQRKLTNHE
jgi:hypothetical protein